MAFMREDSVDDDGSGSDDDDDDDDYPFSPSKKIARRGSVMA
jgi:hypothetical protein